MKKLLIFSTIIALFAATSCVDDDSRMKYPEDNPDFSLIQISSPTSTLSIDFGETFDFTPTVTQRISTKPLEYIWTANTITRTIMGNTVNTIYGEQFSCGEGPTFDYKFDKIGVYRVTLEAKNEDYSEFMSWEVSVRGYDEGIFVVGENEAGICNFAFARKLSETEKLEGKMLEFNVDLLRKANPDVEIKNVVRIIKSIFPDRWNLNPPQPWDPRVFIFTDEKIYLADVNTFQIVLEYDFYANYGERIIAASKIDNASNGKIFTDAGKTYTCGSVGMLISSSPDTQYNDFANGWVYPNMISGVGSVNMYDNVHWVDYSNSRIWAHIPYLSYFGAEKDLVDNSYNSVEADIYDGRDIISVSALGVFGNDTYYSVSLAKDDARDVRIVEYAVSYNNPFGVITRIDYTATSDLTLKPQTNMTVNHRYTSMYYPNGSKVYCWFPTAAAPGNRLPETAAIDLGPGKEATALDISYNEEHLYVAFYDSNRSGELKGGLYIYNASEVGIVPVASIQPIEKFEGITTRPTQVGYKALNQGRYVTN